MPARMRVDIDIIPSPAIIGFAFTHMANAIQETREPLKKAITDVMAPSIRQNFMVGGRPPWEALAESTLEHSGARGGILVKTGALSSQAGQLDEWTIEGDKATLGISDDIWYGIVHQEGIDLPQREWALFQDEDLAKIERIFDDWLGEQVEGSLWP